ncbi:interferon-inducible GTPase 5-like [Paramacrobiotus metropolitanus]|uniref:interferon-inducible GTPase 5-like n=1 Tax=Paramacrobiotus metropolitanus TaxID=2943436 RepID=UPI002445917F|nr:interferon-inducible GTPase 5-like [Paramacrobiotus metropolitanus]
MVLEGLTAGDFAIEDNLDKAEAAQAYEKGGAAELARVLRKRNESWKTVPLNIAVIGNSGVGKSSYINRSRDLGAEDEGAAKVGITETTASVHSYVHPKNPLLRYWDCPGVGTTYFPQTTYLEDIQFKRYDFYLLLSSSRFTANDQWLADQIKKAGKKFFYVRTKCGIDVSNQRNDYPKSCTGKTDAQILQHVRNGIIRNLDLGTAEDSIIFLIDNHKPKEFDFEMLQDKLLEGLPQLKREAFLYSLNPMGMLSKKILQNKVDALRNRVWKVALLSGVVGLVPIPGVSAGFDIGLVLAECKFYQEQLGLDPQSLALTAQMHEVDLTILMQMVSMSVPTVIGKDFLIALGKELAVETIGQVVEEVLKFIPFIGSLVGAPLSFTLTRFMLLCILGRMETAAKEVIDICIQKARQLALEDTRKDCEDLRNKTPAS